LTTYKCLISGSVQGVGYRFYIYQKALFFGISGYVKNLENSQVEVVGNFRSEKEFEGFKNFLVEGSKMSKVTKVKCIKRKLYDSKKFEVISN